MKKPFPHLFSVLMGLALFSSISLAEAPARPLPRFQFKTLTGKAVRTQDLKGKVTVIDFWAVWCKPCIAEVPEYNVFYREYKSKGVMLLGMAADSGTEVELKDAVRRFKIEYPVISLSTTEMDLFNDVAVFPTTWVIDSNGMIAKEILGSPAEKIKTIRAFVDSLLKK